MCVLYGFYFVLQCDLPSETPPAQQMEDFCKENNFLAYFPTSAKEDIGISDAARCLVAQVHMLCVSWLWFCMPWGLLTHSNSSNWNHMIFHIVQWSLNNLTIFTPVLGNAGSFKSIYSA